jgi:type II secretory pathway pseudopilin PulG
LKVFTLVELLVVIVVITILASILMPALSKAKDKALITLCLSRHQQVGVAMTIYALDHNFFYPNRVLNYPSEIGWLEWPADPRKVLNPAFLEYGGATDIYYCAATSRTDPHWPGEVHDISIKINPDSNNFFMRDYAVNDVFYTTIQVIAGFDPPAGNFGQVDEGAPDGPYDAYEPLLGASGADSEDVVAADMCESDNGYTEPYPTAGTPTIPGYGMHHDSNLHGCTGSSRVYADGHALFRRVTDEDYRARFVRAPSLKHLYWFW